LDFLGTTKKGDRMMKGFVKKGLVLLALGILIAGCAGPTEESSSSSSRNGVEGVPMTLDPSNNSLTIGDGSGGYAYKTVDGHSVEVINGTTACADYGPVGPAVGTARCSIRLYNRDPKFYMANAFIVFTACASCQANLQMMDNFDIENIDAGFWDVSGNPLVLDAYTVHPPTTVVGGTFAGGATEIWDGQGSGIAYASDIYNPNNLNKNNPFGAPRVDLNGTRNVKPIWMIAPVCGVGSEVWDFAGGSDNTKFPFYAAVKASWFPMSPLGDDFLRGGTGANADDPRFNFKSFTTFYVTLTDLYTNAADTAWRKVYRPGSIYRSNVLAGYKPPGGRGASGKSVADLTYTTQHYFMVNVGVEASDTTERQQYGITGAVFTYYKDISIEISWNPSVLTTIDAGAWMGTVGAAGSRYQKLANSQCVTPSACAIYPAGTGGANNAHGLDHELNTVLTSVGGGAIDRGGYIGITAENSTYKADTYWSYFETGVFFQDYNYVTDTVVPAGGSAPGYVIGRTFPFRGFANINCMDAGDASCIATGVPDPEPEFWLYNFVLKVKPGNVGRGSEIKVETFEGRTYITNNKNFDGWGGAAGPKRPSDQVAFTEYDGAVMVMGGVSNFEHNNPLIRHRGPAVPENGTAQGWNVAVCIH